MDIGLSTGESTPILDFRMFRRERELHNGTNRAVGYSISLPVNRSQLWRNHETMIGWNARLAFIALLICCAAVRADIFSFTDTDGVLHFTNVPADERYLMVLRATTAGTPDSESADQLLDTRLLEQSLAYEPIIARAAELHKVDAELLKAVIVVESAFDARAVSSAGAQGLMQLMPKTASRFGVLDAFDPEQNIYGGARYLRELMDLYDRDYELVLAAYNAGEAAVDRSGRQIPPYPETLRYVPRVLKVFRTLQSMATQI
jgi:soluble lytic murein transglycosylase-like protein